MARPPKGKPLTLRPIRLDDDVWAECQRLGKEHGTINEGLRVQLIPQIADVLPPREVQITTYSLPAPMKKQDRRFLGPLLKPKERK